MKANFLTAASAFDTWRDNLLTLEPPRLYRVGEGDLSRIEIGPGLVTMFGAPPGYGKTALVMQLTVDALRLDPSIRALVVNVEMTPATLLDRQLARLSGVDLTSIRYRRLGGPHADRIDQAIHALEPVADRLAFLRPPFDLENVAAAADEFEADVIVLDYVQRIRPPGQQADKRGSVDALMNFIRQFADAGAAVVVVAAVARTKDAKGRSSYASDGLNLASFRESSELEFGCDDAFILVPSKDDPDAVTLRHLKARNTEPRDIELHFDRPLQRFTPLATTAPAKAPPPKLTNALAALWQRTKAAPEGVEA